MLTLRSLVADSGLTLRCGEQHSDGAVRWVHITELEDPTPWLSGGELILSTGLQLQTPDSQRRFARRLRDHGAVGIGFGTGFEHATLPPALVEAADAVALALFEVPYDVPFIALTELAFTRIVNEQYELLEKGTAIHRGLERLVLDERGLAAIADALAEALTSAVLVLDEQGGVLAESADAAGLPVAARARAVEGVDGEGHLTVPISAGAHAAGARLVAIRRAGTHTDFERLLASQAATVVALELLRQRTRRATERRLAGDVLADAIGPARESRSEPERDVASRLAPFGVGRQAAVLAFDWPQARPPDAHDRLEHALAAQGADGLVAVHDRLLCAIVDGSIDLDPVALAGALREHLAVSGSGPRAAVSRVAPTAELRRCFHEARCALEATAGANGAAPSVASHRDLGAVELLLALQGDDALEIYCDNVLGPIESASEQAGQRDYGGELLRSLEAFIEYNGQWERAARALYCHRHTLRYRIRRVEELTGRDLKRSRDRIELWLALRGRELLA